MITYLIILANGLVWLRSSYSKFTSGNFIDALGPTLTKFASQNPYPLMKDFLNTIAIPNVKLFATLTMYGEAFAALTLTFISLYFIFNKKQNKLLRIILTNGVVVAMFLNLTFWLASGWTSPSTDGLNLLMFTTEGICLYYLISAKPQ